MPSEISRCRVDGGCAEKIVGDLVVASERQKRIGQGGNCGSGRAGRRQNNRCVVDLVHEGASLFVKSCVEVFAAKTCASPMDQRRVDQRVSQPATSPMCLRIQAGRVVVVGPNGSSTSDLSQNTARAISDVCHTLLNAAQIRLRSSGSPVSPDAVDNATPTADLSIYRGVPREKGLRHRRRAPRSAASAGTLDT